MKLNTKIFLTRIMIIMMIVVFIIILVLQEANAAFPCAFVNNTNTTQSDDFNRADDPTGCGSTMKGTAYINNVRGKIESNMEVVASAATGAGAPCELPTITVTGGNISYQFNITLNGSAADSREIDFDAANVAHLWFYRNGNTGICWANGSSQVQCGNKLVALNDRYTIRINIDATNSRFTGYWYNGSDNTLVETFGETWETFTVGGFGGSHNGPKDWTLEDYMMWNSTLYECPVVPPPPSDTEPPILSNFNMTTGEDLNGDIVGCDEWNTNKLSSCNTSDSTPTVKVTSNENANCRIGLLDVNWTTHGATRDCSGSGTTSHTCTLIAGDALNLGYTNITIGCQDTSSNENKTSSSGNLTVQLWDKRAPFWNQNGTNNSNVGSGESIMFYLNMSDNFNLSFFIFSWNETGIWRNNTNGSLAKRQSFNQTVNLTITAEPKSQIYYQWFFNDSSNNWNSTPIWYFTVRPDYTVNLTINGTLNNDASITYPSIVWINSSCGKNAIDCYLHRNTTIGTILMAAGTNTARNNTRQPAGVWRFTGNHSDNITGRSQLLTVNKGIGNSTLNIPQNTIYGTYVNFNCSSTDLDGGGQAILYRNGTDVTSSENGTSIRLSAGDHLFNCTNLDINFTSSYSSVIYTINKSASNVSLNLYPTSPITYPTQVQANCTTTNLNGNTFLYRNGTDVTSLENGTFVRLINGDNFYNCTTDSQNYTFINVTQTFVVNKAIGNSTLNVFPVSPLNYGTQTQANCTSTDLDSGGKAILYRNGTDVTSTENGTFVTLAAGDHKYNCTNVGIANYTFSNTSYIYTVNKTIGDANLTINGTAANFSQNMAFTSHIACKATSGNASLYEDNSKIISNYSLVNYTKTYIDQEGNHNWTCKIEGLSNHTAETSLNIRAVLTIKLYLGLDLVRADRVYEYGTQTNITFIVNVSLYACLDVGTDINFNCTNCTNPPCVNHINYSMAPMTVNKLFGNVTAYNVSGNGIVNVHLNRSANLISGRLNLTGFAVSGVFPKDISIRLNKSGVSDVVLPGVLEGTVLNVTDFYYLGAKYNVTNITFSTPGKRIIYINLTSFGNPINTTLLISGFTINPEQFFYTESFNDTNNISMENTTRVQIPSYFVDTFEDNWTRTNYTERYARDSSCYIYSGVGSCDQTANKDVVIIDHNLEDNYYYSAASASCLFDTNPGQCIANHNIYLRNDTNIINKSYFSLYTRMKVSASSGSGTSSSAAIAIYLTDRTNSQVIIESPVLPYIAVSGSGGGGNVEEYMNISLRRKSDGSYDIFKNDVFQNNKVFNLDKNKNWTIKITTSPGTSGKWSSGGATAYVYLYSFKQSGVALNQSYQSYNYSVYNGTVMTEVLKTFSTNIYNAKAKCARNIVPNGTTIKYDLSADNGTNWKEAPDNTEIVFNNQGTQLRARFNLTTNSLNYTPVLDGCEISVNPSQISNITIDTGNDGTTEYNFSAVLDEANSPQTVDLKRNQIANYIFDNCLNDTICNVPIAIALKKAGFIEIRDLVVTQNPNYVSLNVSKINDCSVCDIEVNSTGGILQLNAIEIDYRGSANVTIMAHNTDYSINDTLYAYVVFSNYSTRLPPKLDYYEIIPTSANQKNVSPYGQKKNVPIFNITSLAYEKDFDVYIRLNVSLNDTNCTSIKVSNDFSLSNNFSINVSGRKICSNVTVGGNCSIYSKVDLKNCNNSVYSYFEPSFIINTLCSECVETFDRFYDREATEKRKGYIWLPP